MKRASVLIFALLLTAFAQVNASNKDSILGDWESKSWILGDGILRVTELGESHILVRNCDRETYLATDGSDCLSDRSSAYEYRSEISGYCRYREDNTDHYCEVSISVQNEEIVIRKWPTGIYPRLPFGVIAVSNQELPGAVRVEEFGGRVHPRVADIVGVWGSLSYGLALKSDLETDIPTNSSYEIREAGLDSVVITARDGQGKVIEREEFIYDESVNGFCNVEEPGNRWLKYCARLLTVEKGNGVNFLRETWHPREIAGRLHFRPGNRVPTVVAYKEN